MPRSGPGGGEATWLWYSPNPGVLRTPALPPGEGEEVSTASSSMSKKRTNDGGRRALKVRVKTAGERPLSSKRWLQRQLNDPYVARAKREGYRSRAAFKLSRSTTKHHFLKRARAWSTSAPRPEAGARSRPSGSAPRRAGWSRSTCSAWSRSRAWISQVDFLDANAPERLKAMVGGPADVVLSDMAANATGHRATDHMKIMALVEAAAEFAREVLKPGGAFLAKVLQGGTEASLLARSSTTSPRCSTSSRRRAAPIRRSCTYSATGFRGQRD